jgi:hypothetical protein
VDGVSLTHGRPRTHIWTFAAASDEVSSCPHCNCPCILQAKQLYHQHLLGVTTSVILAVVHTGRTYSMETWDGAGCVPLNACCFFNILHGSTSSCHGPPLTMWRWECMCRNLPPSDEDVAIESVEIYMNNCSACMCMDVHSWTVSCIMYFTAQSLACSVLYTWWGFTWVVVHGLNMFFFMG